MEYKDTFYQVEPEVDIVFHYLQQELEATKERCEEMEVYKGYCLYCQGAEIQNLGTPLQFNEWRKQQIECGYLKEGK